MIERRVGTEAKQGKRCGVCLNKRSGLGTKRVAVGNQLGDVDAGKKPRRGRGSEGATAESQCLEVFFCELFVPNNRREQFKRQ